ncbi:MAG: hypothetical protein K6G03_07645, partial [Lachnospiraceae bacterium]|nr:hypothetical protein [Lachnospiraceae bacterium]
MEDIKNSEDLELATHATIPWLLKYTFIPIMTMLFASLYIVVDGIFIANLTSASEYAGSVLVGPFLTCFSAIGFMVGGGGNAYVGSLFGEGKKERAVEIFSMLIEATFILSVVISIIGLLLLKPYLIYQGASGVLLEKAYEYGLIMLAGSVLLALQYVFQLFMITSGDETICFLFTVMAGVVNIALDAFFMMVLHLGVTGAALGTVIGELVGAVLPFIFYIKSKKKEDAVLYFKWSKFELKPFSKVCFNGSSEMVETIAESILSSFFNYQLLRTVGEMGVEAYGSIMYIFLIFNLVFVQFNEAVIPLIAYRYGAKDKKEMKNLISKCLTILVAYSLLFFITSEILAEPLSAIFARTGTDIYNMTVNGLRICSIGLLFMGIALFIPSLYTAIGNGLVSAVITLLEVLVLPAILISILPELWGINGVWATLFIGEAISIVMCFIIVKVLKTDKEIM